MANIYEAMTPLLDGINRVADILSNSAFLAYENAELKIALGRVKNFLGLTAEEATLFCTIFKCYYSYNETPVHIGILSSEAGVTPLRFLEFRDTFKALEEKGFIYTDRAIYHVDIGNTISQWIGGTTTNLACALDEAFERRFLYKIRFEKPTEEIKQKIWKSKLDWLDKSSAEQLASAYSLSGGEIDNVVRKATIQEVLTGKRSSIKEIEGYCRKEKLESSSTAKIGFSR